MHVHAARNVPTAHARAWLGFDAFKPPGRPCVDYLLAMRPEIGLHGVNVAHARRIETRVERRRCHEWYRAVDGEVIAAPLAKATVQHGHALVAERAEHPPQPRRTEVLIRPIVHDDGIVIPHAQRSYALREHIGTRQRVRKWCGLVAQPAQVAEQRARDVRGDVFLPCVAARIRQIRARIDDFDARRREVTRQPCG